MPDEESSDGLGDDGARDSSTGVFPLSAGSSAELLSKAQSYARWLEGLDSGDLRMADLCRAVGSRQGSQPYRLAIVFQSREELGQRLNAFVRGEARARVWSGQAELGRAVRIAFVFCGQGAQWWGMGRQLIATEPRFRATIEECDRILSGLADWSLLRELLADERDSRLSQTEVAQPTLAAFQIALTRLWADFGVEPSAVVGHSVGEIAAAHVAGVLSLKEAMRLAYHRGRIMQRATGRGRMAAVALSSERALEAIRGYEGRVSIAACNSRMSTVLAGDTEPLEELLKTLEQRGVSARKLRVDYAFHSHQMEPLLDDLEASLGSIEVNSSTVPIVSTVTGTRAGRREGDFTALYWRRNVRQPVLFERALQSLIKEGIRTFLEIGPHPVLWIDINHSLEQAGVEGTTVSSLQRDENDRERLLSSLGRFYSLGLEPDWSAVYPGAGPLQLPDIESTSRAEANDPLARWFYQEHWQTRPRRTSDWVPELSAGFAAGRWLIFEDAAGTGSELGAAVGELRQQCLLVRPGGAYTKTEDRTCQVDPTNPEDFRRLIADTVRDPQRRCARIVYLWGLDAGAAGSPESSRAVQGLLHLIQELARAGLRDAPRLWIVTRGAQRASGDEPPAAAAQAWLWGLARAAMHEHPSLRCSLLDLAQDLGARQARLLCGVVSEEDVENQVALRRQGVMIPRLRPSPRPPMADPRTLFREDGVYVVAGGTDSLSLRVTHWLATRGAPRILLLGGREPSAEALKSIELAQAAGASVTAARVDLRDSGAVKTVLTQTLPLGGGIRGIIDCGGSFEEASLLSTSSSRLRSVLEDNAAAAWSLHAASQGLPLDFFVLFSSAFSLLGGRGQAMRAACDAFLDSLADQRRRLGLPAVSVRWAPWSGSGLNIELGEDSLRGLPSLDPTMALQAFERLLGPEAPPIASVMPFNARQWRQSCPALANLALVAGLDEGDAKAVVVGRSARTRIESAPASMRADILRTHLCQTVADVIGCSPALISLDSPLDRLGLTSLKAVSLRNQLEDSLGLRLPATLAWGGHVTVNHFVAHVAERLSIQLQEAAPPEGDEAVLKRLFEVLAKVVD